MQALGRITFGRLALATMLAVSVSAQAVALAAPSPADTANSLPLVVPGFEIDNQPVIMGAQDKPAPAQDKPASPECAVSTDQLPPEFVKLMNRLDEPVDTTATGLPPVVDQVAPAVADSIRTPGRRPAQSSSRSASTRRTEHGVQVLSGGGSAELGRSRENGVTVYRGLEPRDN